LECDSPGFIPSSPYIGADAGWDGYYSGYYRFEDRKGIWSIQSKWTTKTKKDAMPNLKEEIKKELEKSVTNKVEHLRIATNAEFDVPQVLELEKLAETTGITLKIWYREALTIRIESQPFLTHYFFGAPQFPKLIPWNIYFDQLESDLIPIDASISCLDAYIKKAQEFVASKTSSVLLISSPGGYGKSHLLRSVAKSAREIDSQLQTWMIRGGIRTMQDAIQDELVSGRRYILLFDDADRFLEEIVPLLSLVRGSDSVKVVLTMRSSGQEGIYGKIRQLRVGPICTHIDISVWTHDCLIELLRKAAGQSPISHETTIVTLYPNPYLVVWIGRQIAKKPISDFNSLKRALTDDMDHEATTCLAGVDSENLLINISSIVPFPHELPNPILATLASATRIELKLLHESIEKLTKAGILRIIGNGVRFNPDMKGDVYLADKLQTKITENELNQLTETWMPLCPSKFMTNLGSAAKFAALPVAEQTLSTRMKSWAAGSVSPFRSKGEVISALVEISDFLPMQCLEITEAYLQSTKGLTSDDYGPVLSNLIRIESIRQRVVDAIAIEQTKDIEGRYDNYKPKSLIRCCVSPLNNTKELIEATLTQISNWLDKPDHIAKLVTHALVEVLAGAHEYTESDIMTVTYGSRAMPDTAAIRGIRDQALGILNLMLDHSSVQVRLEAMEVAENIGIIPAGGQKEEKLPLVVRIREERAIITPKIGSMINQGLDFRILNRIEQLFLKWWAQLTPGTDGVETYLEKIPRSPEYIAFSYFMPSLFVVEDFNQLKTEAPKEGRWGWFVSSKMRHGFYTDTKFATLVELLDNKYHSPTQIVEFLCQLDKETPDLGTHPPIISQWAKLDPKIFSETTEDNQLWKKVPEKFRAEIRTTLAQNNPASLIQLARDALAALPDDEMANSLLFSFCVCPITQTSQYSNLAEALDRGKAEKRELLLLGFYSALDRARIESLGKTVITQFTLYRWLTRIIKEGSSTLRTAVLFNLVYLAERIESSYLLVSLLRLILLEEHSLSNSMISNLWLVLNKRGDNIRSLDKKVQRRLNLDLMLKLRDYPSFDYDADKLLEFACDSVDALLEFIEYRIHIAETTGGILYEITPLGGLPLIDQLIKAPQEYGKLICGIINLSERYPKWSSFLPRLMENSEQNRLQCAEFIQNQMAVHNYSISLAACEFLPFDATGLAILVEAAEQAIADKKVAEVKTLLQHKTFPTSAQFSAIGEASKGLLARKALFEQMRKMTKSGPLQVIIDDCIHDIDAVIQVELRMDEEILNPRA
jgi:hypothetical protein